MSSNKRKFKPTRTTANKRPKYALPDTESSSSAEEGFEDDSQEEWEALRILKQRGQGFALQYCIEWKGLDPATGKQWAPTWERASNACQSLRASWEARKARLAQENIKPTPPARRGTQQRSARTESPAQATEVRGAEHSRIAESPELSTSVHVTESSTEPLKSAAVTFGRARTDREGADWTSQEININTRRGSFNRTDYESLSDSGVLQSQPSPEESAADSTSLSFTSQPAFLASGIVRDTQSSAGDVSFIPVTQEEEESSLYSNSSDESNEDNVIGYSVSRTCTQLVGVQLLNFV